MLNLEPLWLRHARANLIFFNSFIDGSSCSSAVQFRSQTPYPLGISKLVNTADMKKQALEINVFIVNHSSMRDSLLQKLHLLSLSNIALKTRSTDISNTLVHTTRISQVLGLGLEILPV